MNTNKKSARKLTDEKINIKIKLTALWAALMFFYVYADILGFYTPGVIEKVVSGEIEGVQISESLLLSMAIWMAIPNIMVVLSLMLKAAANRILNLIAGAVSLIALVATFFVGGISARYMFQAVAEGVLMVWIIWLAWNWPKQNK